MRLPDGAIIPNFPPGACWLEKVERYYAHRPSQVSYCGTYEDGDDSFIMNGPGYNYPSQYFNTPDERDKKLSQLEKNLELKEREIALTLKQLKLERAEKESGRPVKGYKEAHLLELMEQMTDEELLSLKGSKAGF